MAIEPCQRGASLPFNRRSNFDVQRIWQQKPVAQCPDTPLLNRVGH